MNKVVSILVILFSVFTQISAQKDTVIYNRQHKEIGIDFQNALRSGTFGGNLVYRKRIGKEEEETFERTKALRFKVGGFVDVNLNNKESIETEFENTTEGNGIIETENDFFPDKHFQIYLLSGIEWQVQKKRIQYYTGFEAGYGFEKQAKITSAEYFAGDLTELKGKNDRRHAALLRGLGGCKFFLSPDFSIGVETSINSSLFFIKESTFEEDRSINTRRVSTNKNKQFLLNFDYLSALYFSYYF